MVKLINDVMLFNLKLGFSLLSSAQEKKYFYNSLLTMTHRNYFVKFSVLHANGSSDEKY